MCTHPVNSMKTKNINMRVALQDSSLGVAKVSSVHPLVTINACTDIYAIPKLLSCSITSMLMFLVLNETFQHGKH